MKGRIPEAIFLDILEARKKVIQDWQDILHGMSVIFFGAQALAVGNITEEFVDPGTVNTQVNYKQFL